MSELIRPELETDLSLEEKLEAVNRYLGATALEVNHSSTEFNWAIRQRIILREQQHLAEQG